MLEWGAEVKDELPFAEVVQCVLRACDDAVREEKPKPGSIAGEEIVQAQPIRAEPGRSRIGEESKAHSELPDGKLFRQ